MWFISPIPFSVYLQYEHCTTGHCGLLDCISVVELLCYTCPTDTGKQELALSWSINPQALGAPTQPDVSSCPDLAGFPSNWYCYLDSLSKAQPFWQASPLPQTQNTFHLPTCGLCLEMRNDTELECAWGRDPAAWSIMYFTCVHDATKLNESRSPLALNNSEHYPLCFPCSDSTKIFIWPQSLCNTGSWGCYWFSQQCRDFSVGKQLRASYLKMIDGIMVERAGMGTAGL